MYIDNVTINSVKYRFQESDTPDLNRFTVIIGENASGKSELLRELIGAVIRAKLGNKEYQSPFVDILDEHLSESYKKSVRQSIKDVDVIVNVNDGSEHFFHYKSYSSKRIVTNYKGEKLTLSDGVFRNSFETDIDRNLEFKPNIIAISSTSYDKFPRIKNNRVMSDNFYICFTSHQIDYNEFDIDRYNIRSSSYNLNYQILTFCESLFLSLLKGRVRVIKDIFSWLSFKSRFKLIYSFNNEVNKLNRDEILDSRELDAYNFYQENVSKEKLPFGNDIDSTREIYIDVSDLSRDAINIIELSKLNCITFHNVELAHDINCNKVMLSTLSSGQLSLIYGLVGLLSRIENNSLIFIDEPEVSLHPKWQEIVLTKYVEIVNLFEKCHLIVATHSPQVASSLDGDHSFVLRIKDSKLIPCSEIKHRSVDFQLADVFEAPNFANDYISTELIKVLTLISKDGYIDHELKQRILKLKNYEKSIKELDPLNNLYHLLRRLEDRLSDKK